MERIRRDSPRDEHPTSQPQATAPLHKQIQALQAQQVALSSSTAARSREIESQLRKAEADRAEMARNLDSEISRRKSAEAELLAERAAAAEHASRMAAEAASARRILRAEFAESSAAEVARVHAAADAAAAAARAELEACMRERDAARAQARSRRDLGAISATRLDVISA